MPFYVYILQSEVDATYYKGFTENPLRRLVQHNAGEMLYSSRKIPWRLVGLFAYNDKRTALIAEKKLKQYDHSRLQSKLQSKENIRENFLAINKQ